MVSSCWIAVAGRRFTCLATLLLAGAVAACGAPEADGTGEGVDDVTTDALDVKASFANVAMRLPKGWEISAEGNTAFVGVHAGGTGDVNLRLQIRYSGDIASLAPTECAREGDAPVKVKSVTAAESGLRPMGSRKAEYRRFSVTCADGAKEEHQAWLLPVSKIAIFEQTSSATNAAVVSKMEVGKLKDVPFANVTFHVPPSWEAAEGEGGVALGQLAGGPRDAELSVKRGFTGAIDTLAPKDCHVEGDAPVKAREVKVVERGLTQLDGAKADFRRFSVKCADGRVEEHRAWVLPVSKIAIFENRATPDIEHVVESATVR